MSKDKVMRCGMLVCTTIAIFAVTANATDLTWDDSFGNWDTDASWLPSGAEPVSTDNVFIQDGLVTINMPAEMSGNLSQTGGIIILEAGGKLSTTGEALVGNQNSTASSFTVQGVGSAWDISDRLVVSYFGNGILNVLNGGTVDSNSGIVAFGDPGLANISGTGSAWNNVGTLWVWDQGELNVEGGAVVSSNGGGVGWAITPEVSTSSTANITGTGSMWNNAGVMNIGGYSDGILNISDGATVTSAGGELGTHNYLVHIGLRRIMGRVNVTGPGSSWTNTGNLIVGEVGAGDLNILAGGLVSNMDASIGSTDEGYGYATVSGTGSTWINQGTLIVGDQTEEVENVSPGGYLTIEDGGAVTSIGARIGNVHFSDGFATVTGSGSTWTNTTTLAVGYEGGGTLDITDGGAVSNTDAAIGLRPGSSGNVTVEGSGSSWTCSSGLFVGGDAFSTGGSGSLLVQSGATVDVAGTIKVWAGSSVTLDGGRITAGIFDVSDGGSFTFSTGELSVNLFLGTLYQDGGLLDPGHSPGITTITGDYEQYAGDLLIELGGYLAGDEYDQLVVHGDVNLNGGGLEVTLINGYAPQLGDNFDILHWNGNMTGGFADLSLPGLDDGLGWELNENGSSDGLLLQVVSTLLADLDGDGFVGLGDLDIILTNWNLFVPPGDPRGDVAGVGGSLGGDGYIGLDDLDVVLANWNAGSPPPIVTANIPEPTTAMLLLLGSTTLVRRRQPA